MRADLEGRLTLAILCLFALASTVASDEPRPATADERREVFEWFGSLGYPDVKNLKFVRVATGGWSQSGNEPPVKSYSDGFLLEDKGDSFTVVELGLTSPAFKKTPQGTPEHKQVGYEVMDVRSFANDLLNTFRERDKKKSAEPWRLGQQIPKCTEVFFLSWACSRNGYDDLATELFHLAERLSASREDAENSRPLKDQVADDIAHAEMWRAVVDFGHTHISRGNLLTRFDRIVKHFPNSSHVPRATETAELLKKMVAEDSEHEKKRKAGKPLAQLPKEEQIAELIFQLRDQNGHQWSQPGSCAIFGLDDDADTPAHRLVKLGFDAVPQLIDALDNDRFSRSVGYHRNFYFSHHVLTVGDCAEEILSRIAGRPFYDSRTTNVAGVKKEVQAWYAELKAKGEKQMLVDAVEKGNDTSRHVGDQLVAKYPDVALAALRTGVRNANRPWVRQNLVSLAGKLKGDDATDFLLSELKQGPTAGDRLIAARALHERGRTEAVETMIVELRRPEQQPPKDDDALPSLDDTNNRSDVAIFLAGSGSVEAVKAVSAEWDKWAVYERLEVVSAFGESGNYSVFSSGSGGSLRPGEAKASGNKEYREAVTAFLVTALDDTEERYGMSGSWGGKSYSDPRICDMAGHVLHQLDAKKYTFDLAVPLRHRDQARAEIVNAWRKEHGLPPRPVIEQPKIVLVPDATIGPLLDTYLDTSDEVRREAQTKIEQLGLAALPGVIKRRDALPAGNADRELLDRISMRLASIVADVRIADRSIKPDKDLAKSLAAIKGNPFDAETVSRIVVSLMRNVPKGVGGFRVGLDGAGEGTGLTLTMELLDRDRAERANRGSWSRPDDDAPRDRPHAWHYQRSASIAGKGLDGAYGTAFAAHSDQTEEFRKLFHHAAAARPEQTVEIRLQVIGQWPKLLSGKNSPSQQ